MHEQKRIRRHEPAAMSHPTMTYQCDKSLAKSRTLASCSHPTITVQRNWLGDTWDSVTEDPIGTIAGGTSKLATPANFLNTVGEYARTGSTGSANYLSTIGQGSLGGVGSALGWATPALSLISGINTLVDDEASSVDKGIGGVKTAAGGAGLLGKGLGLLAGEGALGMSTLGGMSAGTALTGGGAGLGTAAGANAAATSAGAVLGAGLAGYAGGSALYEHTSVGTHADSSIANLDAMLTDPGERSWLLQQVETFDDPDAGIFDKIGAGGKIGLAGTATALAGLGGGIVDAGSAIGGGVVDVWDSIF
ncbi:MAG: hypothetical protein NPIRA04_04720 [Nitrospirales bacterium]|nr:MAG: hypothetical protein NPIRA04_04720 [Nitrospirales bacterium]